MFDLSVFGRRITVLGMAITAIMGLLAGLLIGILVGWGADAAPQYLDELSTAYYVQGVASQYAMDNNFAAAAERMKFFGADWQAAISAGQRLAVAEGNVLMADRLNALSAAIQVNGLPSAPGGGLTNLLFSLGAAVLLMLLVGLLGFLFLLGERFLGGGDDYGNEDVSRSASQQAAQIAMETPATDYSGLAEDERPIAQFMTTYMLGDDLYDDSFSIDDANGDFLGECGVGLGETIGVGDPKKVQTFEIWLFDKNDIRTVTRVLMSEHAFRDETLKARLQAKGEPAMAQPGQTFDLETASLRVVARIVDMQYGSGPLPPNSYFQQVTIELAAFKRESETAPQF